MTEILAKILLTLPSIALIILVAASFCDSKRFKILTNVGLLLCVAAVIVLLIFFWTL